MAAETNPGQVDYPYPYSEQPFEPGKDGWKKQSLYGIVGWYSSTDKMFGGLNMFKPVVDVVDLLGSFNYPELEERAESWVQKAVAFSGYLKVDQEGNFTGLSSDPLGLAQITGTGGVEGDALMFQKRYHPQLSTIAAATKPIDYIFRKEPSTGLWIGRYTFESVLANSSYNYPDHALQITGQAACRTLLFHGNAFGIHTDLPRRI